MKRVSFVQQAEEGERFAPGAFDSQIGKVIPFTMTEGVRVHARVVSAEVSPDGQQVRMTLEVLDLLRW